MEERGLDFKEAARVFRGVTVEIEDLRKAYGERRIICFGLLMGRMVVVGYPPPRCSAPCVQHEKGQ